MAQKEKHPAKASSEAGESTGKEKMAALGKSVMSKMSEASKIAGEKMNPALEKMRAASQKALDIKTLSVGELMVEKGLLDKSKLSDAYREVTMQRTLLQVIVEEEYAPEDKLLEAINGYYKLHLTAIDEHTEEAIKNRPMTLAEKIFHTRVPIRVKLSLATAAILAFTLITLSYMMLQHQRELMYKETVKTGKVSLNYFVTNARESLLNEDVLKLSVLINEASKVDGLVYAFVVGRKGQIMAHTDLKMRGKPYSEKMFGPELIKEEGSPYFSYFDAENREILNLSSPVDFHGKNLGEIHVGISLDFINEQIANERLFIFYASLIMILLGVAVAIYMGVNFSRPILALAVGTQEIGEGNLMYRVNVKRQDELGDLAKAFNFMAADLYKKQLMEKSFGSYVSPEVLELILDNPENPWVKGSRNEASVLFTDVRGFTAFSEVTEPELVVETLNEYFTIGTEVILDYGGYVDKFIGDAILGVFGVPVAQKDHAMRAVKASYYMQQALIEASKKKGIKLLGEIGIGINSGVLVSGNIGSSKKMEYTVIGDTVNVASRLNGLAKSGEVVFSKDTLALLDKTIKVEELPPAKVKGKTEPIQVFKVVSIG